MESNESSSDFENRLKWITISVISFTAIAQLALLPVLPQVLNLKDIAVSEAFLLILALWTWFMTASRLSPKFQIPSLLLEIALLFCASYFGAYKIFHFVFMCIVAKAALQLNFKPLVAVMGAVFGSHVLLTTLKSNQYYQTVAHYSGGILPPHYPKILSIENHFYFLFAMSIVAAMMRTMISERRSRLRAEQLADDVQELIIKNERARISRDIHDGLGHTLTSLNIQLDVAKTMLDKDHAVAVEALNIAKDLASESLSDVRKSVHMIRDQDRVPFNLSEAVTTLASRSRNSHGVDIELSIDAPELPLFKAHNLFCIVQEALTNAQRHAQAKSIKIIFNNTVDQLKVLIADDGVGFTSQTDLPGLGLRSMNERAQGVGGTLQIDSAPGNGTKVCLTLPL